MRFSVLDSIDQGILVKRNRTGWIHWGVSHSISQINRHLVRNQARRQSRITPRPNLGKIVTRLWFPSANEFFLRGVYFHLPVDLKLKTLEWYERSSHPDTGIRICLKSWPLSPELWLSDPWRSNRPTATSQDGIASIRNFASLTCSERLSHEVVSHVKMSISRPWHVPEQERGSLESVFDDPQSIETVATSQSLRSGFWDPYRVHPW